MRTLAATMTLLLLLPAILTHAATITVDWSGSGDYMSIQEGLDAGSPGDTILVLPGIYGGPDNDGLSFGGKDMVLRSAYGPGSTHIDNYSGWNSVFHIHEGETRNAVVDGFTVSSGSGYGPPVFDIHDASPTIQNCRFTNNYAWGSHHTEGWCGVGSFYRSSGALLNCWMESNRAHCGIGAVGIVESSIDVENCTFIYNRDEWEGIGTLYIRDSGGTSIYGCLFVDNRGSESCIYAYRSYPLTVENCTFVDNGGSYWSSTPGGAIIGSYGPSPMLVRNCIFAFNRVDKIMVSPDYVTIGWCCVYANTCGDTLTGNYDPSRILWEDPHFCNMDTGDCSLCSNSPCLPSVSGWDNLVGAYDVGCGDCNSPVEATSWGRIKAMYRQDRSPGPGVRP